MTWLNEPTDWQKDTDSLILTTNPQTDFWRLTHDSGIRDNGHFYFKHVNGDFVASAKISGSYKDLYDQAGLMVRVDDKNWLKCGIEFVEGVQYLSTVVTRDYSDWAVIPLLQKQPSIYFKIKASKTDIEILYSLDDHNWQLLRQTFLPHMHKCAVGLMAASPKGNGFRVKFTDFIISSQ
jgi:uncharacterized protein